MHAPTLVLVSLAVTAALFVRQSVSMVCPPDVCDSLPCEPVDEVTCGGKFVRHGGFCGCCHVCLHVIEPMGMCVPPDLTVGAKAVCADGYWCNQGQCRPLLG